MPPKPKFRREEVIEAALALIDEQGVDALTARELGRRLGSSARPIFTLFQDMDELHREVRAVAATRFGELVAQASDYTPAIIEAGMRILRFAFNKPHLFQLVVLPENVDNIQYYELFSNGHGSPKSTMHFLEQTYDLSASEAELLYRHFMLTVYGIAMLGINKAYVFPENEVVRVLGIELQVMLDYIKAGKLNDQTPVIRRITEAEEADSCLMAS